MSARIVVTGIGVVCSAGDDLTSLVESVSRGASCLSRIEDPRVAHLTARYAGLIPDFQTASSPNSSKTPLDRFVALAAAAAASALSSASVTDDFRLRMGIVCATCSGPMQSIEAYYGRRLTEFPELDDSEFFATRYYSASRLLAHLCGIEGINVTVTTACSASINAIATAANLIRTGMIDGALVGGSDAFSLTTLAGFDGVKATTPGLCAPFSSPAGMNLGEGAGFLVIESYETAAARGAEIFAEVLGYGTSNDAYHCTSPDPSGKGQAAAMLRALKAAGMDSAHIGYVGGHGTGTEANDRAETKAVRRVFGDRSDLMMSSLKPVVGHCLGAAGAIELIGTIGCARDGIVPPTGNFTIPREGCNVDAVSESGTPWPAFPAFLKNNFATE